MENREIDLLRLGKVVIRRWRLMLAVGIVFALIAAIGYLILVPKKYVSSTQLVVARNGKMKKDGKVENSELVANAKMADTYRKLLKSGEVLKKVSENPDLKISVAALSDSIQVGEAKNSDVIDVNVTMKNPEQATLVLQKVLDSFKEQAASVMKVQNIQVVTQPTAPTQPSGYKWKQAALAAFLFGVVAVMIFAAIPVVFDIRLGSARQLKELYEIPVIGNIPYVKREVKNENGKQ